MAISGVQGLGYSAAVDVTASRAINGTTYYNTSGRPKVVSIRCTATSVAFSLLIVKNGAAYAYGPYGGNTTDSAVGAYFIVNPGESYSVSPVTGSATLVSWKEE